MSGETAPLLSVIIPTCDRPQSLARAIDSALRSAPEGCVEVIVVPNGPSQGWTTVSGQYARDSRVRWFPVSEAHANVARNRGLQQARGQYVRFLDDDDVLYPESACRQLLLALERKADICSGSIDMRNDDGRVFGIWTQNGWTTDFVSSVLASTRALQVTAHLILRDVAMGSPWDESKPFSQDICWFMDIVGQREISWVVTLDVVGAWSRSTYGRMSTGASMNARRKIIAERLVRTACELDKRGGINPERRYAIADGMWQQIYNGLIFSPLYWMGMVRWILKYAPGYKSRILALLMGRFRDSKLQADPLLCLVFVGPAKGMVHLVRELARRTGFSTRW